MSSQTMRRTDLPTPRRYNAELDVANQVIFFWQAKNSGSELRLRFGVRPNEQRPYPAAFVERWARAIQGPRLLCALRAAGNRVGSYRTTELASRSDAMRQSFLCVSPNHAQSAPTNSPIESIRHEVRRVGYVRASAARRSLPSSRHRFSDRASLGSAIRHASSLPESTRPRSRRSRGDVHVSLR